MTSSNSDKQKVKRLSFAPFRAWYVSEHPTGKKEDMVEELRTSWKTISKVWGDKLPVTTDIIEKICNAYDLSIEQVVVMKKEDK